MSVKPNLRIPRDPGLFVHSQLIERQDVPTVLYIHGALGRDSWAIYSYAHSWRTGLRCTAPNFARLRLRKKFHAAQRWGQRGGRHHWGKSGLSSSIADPKGVAIWGSLRLRALRSNFYADEYAASVP